MDGERSSKLTEHALCFFDRDNLQCLLRFVLNGGLFVNGLASFSRGCTHPWLSLRCLAGGPTWRTQPSSPAAQQFSSPAAQQLSSPAARQHSS
jgi:hypothetical protein